MALVEEGLAQLNLLEMLQVALPSGAPAFEGMGEHKQTLLNVIAGSLWKRFKESRSVEDLDISIEFQHSALQQTPEHSSDHANWLGRLGVSYQYRYDRLGELEDLGKAVEFNEQAVLRAANDRPAR
ncbi:hypothetical protein FRC06_008373, partial [Ceratobasidium sp. 370]